MASKSNGKSEIVSFEENCIEYMHSLTHTHTRACMPNAQCTLFDFKRIGKINGWLMNLVVCEMQKLENNLPVATIFVLTKYSISIKSIEFHIKMPSSCQSFTIHAHKSQFKWPINEFESLVYCHIKTHTHNLSHF